ncbi:PTS sugar transporter subunit IIA [Anaerococcus sp. Marseille-Q7828]|uniref:PTS sugar transporter subunit IIA n=1 Tax=Anaerococcus sp. Marseille-Q7828 TaxID=3036300 RepID=UPI0024ADA6BF|nr:PTS sugar transporter subunit IIA [Anaerococcus sp. Marseille-Q7828]
MKILLVSHGNLSKSLIDSAEMLVGETDGLDYLIFDKNMGIDELKDSFIKYLYENEEELLIFTDIKGGTPFNVASILTNDMDKVHIFYGMNLPMIVEAALYKDEFSMDELVEQIKSNISDCIGLI